MGACDFETMSHGSDATTAFSNARSEAQAESGERGYTGTIAEKPSFTLFTLPTIVPAAKVVDALCDGPVPDGMDAGTVRRMQRLYDDKWGPAVAMEITGKAATAYRARMGLKGKRVKVYVFCGLASS